MSWIRFTADPLQDWRLSGQAVHTNVPLSSGKYNSYRLWWRQAAGNVTAGVCVNLLMGTVPTYGLNGPGDAHLCPGGTWRTLLCTLHICDDWVTHMRSGRYRWMIAQNASPLFHDDVMLVTLTSRYPSHCRLHHCCSPLTLAAIDSFLPVHTVYDVTERKEKQPIIWM